MSGERDIEQLAQRLREAREYLNFSQQYVSDQTGMQRSAISDIERGARRVSTLELKRLANVYGYRASYLLGEEPPGELAGPAAVLAREASELTPADQQEVQRFITFLRSRNEPG